MKVAVFDHPDVFAELENEWNHLLERSTANRIFSSWEWNSAWWDVYQPGQLWVVTCRDHEDRLVGLAPWFITDGPEPMVSTIGCREVSDYLDLIIDKEYVDPVLETLAGFLKQNLARFDRIELCNIPADSIGNTHFPDKLQDCDFQVRLEPEDVCPIVELPETWGDYLALLDKKYRHELRRKLRRAQGTGKIDWYVVSAEHDLETEMQQFFRLMAASDPDKEDFLVDSANHRFFQRITRVLLTRGWLQLSFLTVDGQPAATYLNFDYNGHILVYNSGLAPEYSALSPGIVLLAYNIQHAIENRRKVFDFLQGSENYKYHMGGKDKVVVNLIAESRDR